jgi:Dolichyl-phosphate-mannose-protein mannosyltransferase
MVTRRDLAVAAGLVAALGAVYSANGEVLPGTDAVPNVYLAADILEEGRLAFTPERDPWLFSWTLATARGPAPLRLFDLRTTIDGSSAGELLARGALQPDGPYFLTAAAEGPAAGHRFANRYGAGAAVAALPVLAMTRALRGDLRRDPTALWYGAKLAASLLAALGAALVYLACRSSLGPGASLVLSGAYALGTPVWSQSSQTLWQHPANGLFVAAGVFCLLRAGSTRWFGLAGLAFSLATACRPTSALFLAGALVYLVVTDRRALVPLVAGAVPVALVIAAYNWHVLGSPFRFGQSEFHELAGMKTGLAAAFQVHPVAALTGLLLSPSRGLLVFSPFLLVAIPGSVWLWRRDEHARLRPVLLGLLMVFALDLFWFDWWGGWSYGWRRLVDLGPALTVLMIPAWGWLTARRWRKVALALLVTWSVLLQLLGAFAYDPEAWNARPAWRVTGPGGATRLVLEEAEARRAYAAGAGVEALRLNVDEAENRDRLWSVRDGQIAYLLGHLGEAVVDKRAASRDWIEFWRPPPP